MLVDQNRIVGCAPRSGIINGSNLLFSGPCQDAVLRNLILYSVLFFLCPLAALAQGQSGGDWEYELKPLYVWGAGISADTAVNGTGAPLDTDYSFFSLSNIEMAGSIALNGNNGRWGFNLDAAFVDFSDDFTLGSLTTEVGVDGGIYEVNGEFYLNESWVIYAGARHLTLDAEIDLSTGAGVSRGKDWIDPIIGLHFQRQFNDSWYTYLSGDIGGFGVSSDFTGKFEASVGYRFTETISAELGYRYFKVDFEKDRFVFDAAIQGIVFGVVFRL